MRSTRISYAIGRYESDCDRHWYIRHDTSPASCMLTADPLDARRFPSADAAREWAGYLPGEVKKRIAEWPPIVVPIRAELAGESTPLSLDASDTL